MYVCIYIFIHMNIYIYIYIYISCISGQCVHTSCVLVYELPQSHCGDNQEGHIVFMIVYMYMYMYIYPDLP